MVYYNEIDEYAAAWLSRLMDAGVIVQGAIDTRSIEDVTPDDLKGFTQCHFFAGIGGWSYALRLAGWPDDRPVWTGSCPCQPFSAAGKGLGFADERHLWPSWFWLIQQCRPRVIFGEQVATAVEWLDLVATDLEGEDYACGPIVLPAASVKAKHARHRLWFVADPQRERRERLEHDNRVFSSPQEAFSVDHDTLARAGTALDGDFECLLPGDGLSVQVERNAIKAFGNAIVPPLAAEVIKAYCEVRGL